MIDIPLMFRIIRRGYFLTKVFQIMIWLQINEYCTEKKVSRYKVVEYVAYKLYF